MKYINRKIISLALIGCLSATWGIEPESIYEKAEISLDNGNLETAASLMMPLAKQGDAHAQYLLSFALHSKDPEQSKQWRQKSADQGYIHAQFRIALDKTSENKQPIPQDLVDKMIALADKNDKEALLQLTWLPYVYESKEIKSNFNHEIYIQKAALQDIPAAQVLLSNKYSDEKNIILAIFWARKNAINVAKKAKKGSIGAQLQLGYWYRNGNPLLISSSHSGISESIAASPSLALYWLQQAAQKSAQGSEELGEIYFERYSNYASVKERVPEKISKEEESTAQKWQEQAIYWFEKSVEQGNHQYAAKQLAELYSQAGTPKEDLAQAKKYHEMYMASLIKEMKTGTTYFEPNDPSRQKDIGTEYVDAPAGLKNFAEAEKWFKKSYEQGYAKAATALGLLYLNPDNPNKKFATAKEWLEKASEKGEYKAMLQLGEAYFKGTDTKQDLDAAKIWFKKALEQDKNNYKAQRRLEEIPLYKKYTRSNAALTEGIVRFMSGNQSKAKQLLEPLAQSGNAEAQYYISQINADWGGADKKWLQKSAEGGFAEAQKEWALMIFNNTAVDQSERYEKTLLWMEKAAVQNNQEAVLSMAQTYEQGIFTERDNKKALKWYEKLLTLDDIGAYRNHANDRIQQLKAQLEQNN
ncbi:MAG: sel1 repeat family protein [Gammaproteobacteria bacterium]|nr:sel1 repeat family protein [Gammaproteobacteria bacterium]